MKIAIIGAGAVGSTLGALLARRGQDVTLIGRPAHVAAIRSDGLRVEGHPGEFTVQVNAAETLDFQPDLALLTVKTQDVTTAVQDNLACLTDVPLVTLQNGVRSDALVAALLPSHQILRHSVRDGHLSHSWQGDGSSARDAGRRPSFWPQRYAGRSSSRRVTSTAIFQRRY